jgi:hypothetical protein
VEHNLTGPFHLPGAIAPIVFFDASGYCDMDFALVCEGRYYLYENGPYRVRRYHAAYADPGAFLRACVESFFEVPP